MIRQITYALPMKQNRPDCRLRLLYATRYTPSFLCLAFMTSLLFLSPADFSCRLEKRRTAIPELISESRARKPLVNAVLREMQIGDLNGVMAIEIACFEQPYDPSYFVKALRKSRVSIIIASCQDEPVAAYAAFWANSLKRYHFT